MAWRFKGRLHVSPSDPHAGGTCDRCYIRYNLRDLKWQWQWAGPQLQNLRILVCQRCLDKPQEQLRTIVLPPDPVPVLNPRPEDYASDNSNWVVTQGGERVAAQNGDLLTTWDSAE